MDKHYRTAATRVDLVLVTAICFGLFIISSLDGVMRGFPTYQITDQRLASLVFIELAAAAVAVSYLRIRHYDMRSLFPSPTLQGVLVGVGLYLLAWGVGVPLEALLNQHMPTASGTSGTLHTAGVSTAMILLVSVVNGLYEEMFLLGFLQRALKATEGHFAVGTVLLLRISYHLYQGADGVVFVTVFGIVAGYYYLKTGKLWPVVVAHVTADVVALAAN